jgi:cellulose biosynthesis protein BcsQ
MSTGDLGRDLGRTVAVINGKGGVLKTSIVANVAGILAEAGMRVLAVDLDISGNLKLDFGLADDDADDMGKGLVDAIWMAQQLPVVAEVRPGLDFVFGGRALELLSQLAKSDTADQLPNGSVAAEFAARLSDVADGYDLILLDCPPGNGELQDMALAAAGWVLIPTRTDQASWDGLLGVGPRVRRARRLNPDLRYLGVVITAHNPSATRVHRNTAARLGEVGEKAPLLRTVIRHSETAAHDCRSRGQLAHELARDAATSRTRRLEALSARRRGERDGQVISLPSSLSGTADSLAGDYRRLAQEICDRIAAAETDAIPAGGQAR